jgi:hypothetical protein
VSGSRLYDTLLAKEHKINYYSLWNLSAEEAL